ncbi:protein FAM118A isoform X8 [Ovis canadensis]|uniref:protein FAM118A isoform X8 n=1 Tax=Ovis canadensis TaxID=37174 RepID=UPI0037500647
MDSVEKTTNRSEQKSRKFLKSLIRKQPQELLLVIGTGVSAAVAPGIPALCSWRSCIEAVIEAAEQLEVLHPGDVAEFRRKVTKDGDLLVVAHDLIRKMSPVLQWARGSVRYGVLHIHGLYTDPCGVVLDPSGYRDVTQDPEVMAWGGDECRAGLPPPWHGHGRAGAVLSDTEPLWVSGSAMQRCAPARSSVPTLRRFSRACTAPSPSCSWAAGRRCVTRSSRPSSCTRCPTRWSWSTTCWCSRRARTISSSSRRTCCCTASRSCPTGTASTTSQGTCRTSPLRSANSEVQMPIEWTAPRCWGMHARTVQRGS